MLRTKLLQLLPAAFLFLISVSVIVVGSGYKIGSLTAMGPGFMPVALGVCIMLLSLVLATGELRIAPENELSFPLRPVLWVGGGILAWALLIDTFGFFPASIVQLLFSSFALPQQGWRTPVILALGMTLASYIVFVTLLGVPVPAFGS
ncbi:MAG: tripartite tricarboxylate transporter TctB family protein [Pseudomonadota bacterium]